MFSNKIISRVAMGARSHFVLPHIRFLKVQAEKIYLMKTFFMNFKT